MRNRAYRTRSNLARIAILVLAAFVLVGTSPALAAASQPPRESHPDEAAVKSSAVQSSWDLVDQGQNLHYELDTAYAEYFEAAAASWNELGAVNIAPSPSSSETDVVVTDGSLGGPMATTRSDGIITFDASIMDASTPNAQETAGAHELGHALGFGHVSAESVMTTPIISNANTNYAEPTSYDEQEYRERWGSAPQGGTGDGDEPQSEPDQPQSDDDRSQPDSPQPQEQPQQEPQPPQYEDDDGPGGSTPPEGGEEETPDTGNDPGQGGGIPDDLLVPPGGGSGPDTGGSPEDGTGDQPDSAQEGDDGSQSPESSWTPEECFPFCETGGSPASGDDASEGSSNSQESTTETEDTTKGNTGDGDTGDGNTGGEGSSTGESGEDGSSRGFTHAPDTDEEDHSTGDGPIHDQVMTSQEACDALEQMQKDIPEEARKNFTTTVENAIDCDGSGGDDSSPDGPAGGSPDEERSSASDEGEQSTEAEQEGDAGEETVTDDNETTRQSTNTEQVQNGDTEVSNDDDVDQGNRGDATAGEGADKAAAAARETGEETAGGGGSCGEPSATGPDNLGPAISEKVACEIGEQTDGATGGLFD